MRGCLNVEAISPSVGFFKPLNRASSASVFALSKTFRPTILPVSRSRAMLKFDMVPETASRRISYRLATSTLPPSINDLKNWPMPTGLPINERQVTRIQAKALSRKGYEFIYHKVHEDHEGEKMNELLAAAQMFFVLFV